MEKPSTQEVSISTSAPTPTCLPLPALGKTVRGGSRASQPPRRASYPPLGGREEVG